MQAIAGVEERTRARVRGAGWDAAAQKERLPPTAQKVLPTEMYSTDSSHFPSQSHASQQIRFCLPPPPPPSHSLLLHTSPHHIRPRPITEHSSFCFEASHHLCRRDTTVLITRTFTYNRHSSRRCALRHSSTINHQPYATEKRHSPSPERFLLPCFASSGGPTAFSPFWS